jgi:hypothetical protein
MKGADSRRLAVALGEAAGAIGRGPRRRCAWVPQPASTCARPEPTASRGLSRIRYRRSQRRAQAAMPRRGARTADRALPPQRDVRQRGLPISLCSVAAEALRYGPDPARAACDACRACSSVLRTPPAGRYLLPAAPARRLGLYLDTPGMSSGLRFEAGVRGAQGLSWRMASVKPGSGLRESAESRLKNPPTCLPDEPRPAFGTFSRLAVWSARS